MDSIKVLRPKNGCARCMWWHHQKEGWGKCRVIKDFKTWYKHAPCSEFELNPLVDDHLSF